MPANRRLYLYALCTGLVFYAPVALYLRTNQGMTVAQVFWLQAILEVGIFVFEVPCGWMTDKIGYKRSIVLSSGLLLLARSCFFVADNFVWFALEALLESLSICFISGTMQAFLFTLVRQKDYQKTFAWYDHFATLGFILSNLGFYVMFPLWGMQGLLCATIVSSVLACLVSCWLPTHTSSYKHREKVIVDLSLFKQGVVWRILLGEACISLGSIVLNLFFVEKLTLLGIADQYMAFIILGYATLQLLTPKLVERIKAHHQVAIYATCFVLAGSLFLGIFMVSKSLVVMAMMLVLPLFLYLPQAFLSEKQQLLIEANHHQAQRATMLSMMSMGQNALGILSLIVFAIFPMQTKTYPMMVVGFALVLYGLLMYTNKQVDNH